MPDIDALELFGAHHDAADFDCGQPSLNDWLRKRALANQTNGASRTYAACKGGRVIGYHALAASSLSPHEATGRIRRNMPDPIPVIVLGRLAVDMNSKGKGLGRTLMADAIERASRAASVIGVRAIIVHALSDEAKAFYRAIGFDPSPISPMLLMIAMSDIAEGERRLA
jgi:GNAT superfamily N-acetyltransferase